MKKPKKQKKVLAKRAVGGDVVLHVVGGDVVLRSITPRDRALLDGDTIWRVLDSFVAHGDACVEGEPDCACALFAHGWPAP